MPEGRNSINLPTPDPRSKNDKPSKRLKVEPTPGQGGQVDKIKLFSEAVDLAGEVAGVLDNYFELEEKREKWRGRVEEAELELEKEKVSLEKTKDSNDVKRERLKTTRRRIDTLSEMLKDMLDEMQTLEGEPRERLRDKAIRIAELLTKI